MTFAKEVLAVTSLHLQSRLTRGGLAPEAVQKALEAFEAGDIHALNFSLAKGRLICPIPQELLVRVFPKLADIPTKATAKDLDHLSLEYEINRHHGGLKSLTLKWPEEEVEHAPIAGATRDDVGLGEEKLSLTEHRAALTKEQAEIVTDKKFPPPADGPEATPPEIPGKRGTGAGSRGSYPGPHPDDTKPAPEPLPVGRQTKADDDETPF